MCARNAHTGSGWGSEILASVAKWSKNIRSKFQVCSYHSFQVISVLKPKFRICAECPLFSDPVTYIHFGLDCTKILILFLMLCHIDSHCTLRWPPWVVCVAGSLFLSNGLRPTLAQIWLPHPTVTCLGFLHLRCKLLPPNVTIAYSPAPNHPTSYSHTHIC